MSLALLGSILVGGVGFLRGASTSEEGGDGPLSIGYGAHSSSEERQEVVVPLVPFFFPFFSNSNSSHTTHS